MNDDPYVYPGSLVLKNNLGIREAAQLEVAERVVTRARMRQPMTRTPAVSPEGYQAIHRHIFQDVYAWAGDPNKDGRAKHFQNAKVVNVENAGHWVHHDQLDVFMDLVDGFL